MNHLHPVINARIECSAKTLKELGLSKEVVTHGTLDVDPFFSWYCHFFFLNRKKCLLFVNTLTRYPVLAINLSRKEIKQLNSVLGETLRIQLLEEGVPDNVIDQLLLHLYKPEISKSKNRSVIGTAVTLEKDLRAHLQFAPYDVRAKTQIEMSLLLARTPICSMKPDPFPERCFSNELLKRYGETGHFES
jgi:hypothetical protein